MFDWLLSSLYFAKDNAQPINAAITFQESGSIMEFLACRWSKFSVREGHFRGNMKRTLFDFYFIKQNDGSRSRVSDGKGSGPKMMSLR